MTLALSPRTRFLAAMVLCAGLLAGCTTPRVVGRDLDASARSEPERLIVVAVSNATAATTPSAGSTPRGYQGSARYAVSGQAQRDLLALAAAYDIKRLAEWPIAVLGMECAVFQLPKGASATELLARLNADPRVKLAQPMQSFATQAQSVSDPYLAEQSSLQAMDVFSAQQQSLGKGIRVAVIDTGLDTAHPDLQGRVAAQQNFVDHDEQQFRRDRHGTLVGGAIAANRNNGVGISGVAPEAQLLALKACWQLTAGQDAAACNSYTLAQSLAKAIDLHAQVINLSLAGPADPLLTALVERAIERGIVVVGPGGAAGSRPAFPDNVPGLVRVVRADAPNVSDSVLRAPGSEVLTLAPNAGYGFSSGDSVAVAHVSGIAALLLAFPYRPDAARVSRLLQPTDSSRVVNACHAVASLTGAGHCR